jgi:tetratricopeptide (TPR) repeat protein
LLAYAKGIALDVEVECMFILTRCFYFLLLTFLIVGCQSQSALESSFNEKNDNIFLDDAFTGYKNIELETENTVFALDDEMKSMVATKLLPERDTHKKAVKLLRHIFNKNDIDLAYKSGANVIASEAFHNQQANCLSLTIMAYALAKEAGLNVVFQDVKIPEYWVRNGHINMLTGHVNLKVVEEKSPSTLIFLDRSITEIDFDPYVVKKSFPKREITKQRVLAMFYNNKGANALVDRDFIKAYAYLKKAVEVDKNFSSAWGNIGILYRFSGLNDSAIKAYSHALSLNIDNLTAMSNLSLLLHNDGRFDEANTLDAYLIKKRANNPYYYALLADESFYAGHYQLALNHYRKAIKLDNNIHEFYFGLAKVYYMLEEVEKAQRFLKKAIAKNKVNAIEHQYMAKLNVMRQVEMAK